MMGMRDTSAEAEAIQDEIYRRMGPEGRFEAAWNMSLMAREFSLARIRSEHPGDSEAEVMRIYVREILSEPTYLP
jgi:hypothetical protein